MAIRIFKQKDPEGALPDIMLVWEDPNRNCVWKSRQEGTKGVLAGYIDKKLHIFWEEKNGSD